MKNKSVIITGASRGIGEAAARKFAELGAKVLLCARSTGDIERIADEINADGGTAIALATDVAVFGQVQAAIDLAQSQFGGVDVLINNAGLLDPVSRLESSDVAAWDKVIDVNVKGVYYGMRAAVSVMKSAGGGTIITIGSGAATSALEGWSHYNTSKAAVHHLNACLHGEEGENGIRALVLSPGTVATEMQRIIKKSGVNPVSTLEWEDHRPPSVIADTLAWMCTSDADDYLGDVVRQSDPEILNRLGQS
ncbi:SDR family oxidoreductase [Amylibacter sp. IMCC11727]|uniref:SDR family oxidoreductase n=1 Tax=Amylibacter sp. IMCC11727 TaxID=3039851 RepID=UPI00244E4732|nr:SDR family oxidoreductase [Amylibacter sp. IMCC11727]WGI22238.1 SDR family NAD(P)-dependent oxidoreductase [Amylibacter sp. IMCC11727]